MEINPDMVRDLETAFGRYAASRLELLGAGTGIARAFGSTTVLKTYGFSGTWLGSCVSGLSVADRSWVRAILEFLGSADFKIDLAPGQIDDDLAGRLYDARLRHTGFEAVVAAAPGEVAAAVPAATRARQVGTAALPDFLSAYGEAFDTPRLTRTHLTSLAGLGDLPGVSCWVAGDDGRADAVGVLSVSGGIAVLVDSATRPYARRRGLQVELIQARCAAAAELGCNVVAAEVGFASRNHRCMLRAGLATGYTRAIWTPGGGHDRGSSRRRTVGVPSGGKAPAAPAVPGTE